MSLGLTSVGVVALSAGAVFFVTLAVLARGHDDAPPPASGMASWYGYELLGRPMANGRPFDPEAMTCASWDWPLGTVLRVESAATGKSILVTVTDRGPAKRLREQGRIIDLSRAAFAKLADTREGLIPVIVEVAR